MVKLDALSRHSAWMLFVSSFCLCVQKNHLNVTMFICFLFFNMHLHLGELVNEMIKIYIFKNFGGKIAFLRFWRKIIFAVFAEKCVLTKKSVFLWFWRKNMVFAVLAGILSFCGFGGKK